jgi:hypothetical protein
VRADLYPNKKEPAQTGTFDAGPMSLMFTGVAFLGTGPDNYAELMAGGLKRFK